MMLKRRQVVLLVGVLVVLFSLNLTGALAQSQPGQLARETAREYRDRARYPGHSWVLAAGQADPLFDQRTPSRQSVQSLAGTNASLTIWCAEVSFQSEEPVDLFAALNQSPDAVDQIQGEVVSESGEIVATVTFLDDGRDADRARGDGVYSARVTSLPVPELAESFLVRVEALLASGEELQAAGGFLLSNPGARLTGRYRDSFARGNLVVRAQVDVQRAGRFHLAGTLATLAGEAVGVAQTAVELEPGEHWVKLEFFGLMFHDRRVNGPFRLRSLALSNASGMPNALAPLAQNVYTTRAYPQARFRQSGFGRPHLLDAAERLEAEAVRSEAQIRDER